MRGVDLEVPAKVSRAATWNYRESFRMSASMGTSGMLPPPSLYVPGVGHQAVAIDVTFPARAAGRIWKYFFAAAGRTISR